MMMKMKKLLSVILAAVMLAGLLPAQALALRGGPIQREYGDTVFTKISNPGAGSGQPDGINTNDETGFAPNRLNSYAWAVASRGDYIYIGTNRTLFGSALNALGETMRKNNPDLSQDTLNALASVLSGGDVPKIAGEEDYIPQIIRFDVEHGTTKVIYQPRTVRGEDGALYYADKDGKIVDGADVLSEAASFRSVIEYKGNLYFGSLGTNMLQLVRVDEEDNAEVVFQTLGLVSSLRACCVYDDGNGETVYFGGQDTTYPVWRAYRQKNPEGSKMPIVIRYLDPDTAGKDQEDWSHLVADFRDFGKYAEATVYKSGGGNVWDLCSYNGKLYLILAYDGGWAMFRGENVGKGTEGANDFGWKWTEIVGDTGKYPLAMDTEIAEKNEELRKLYGCKEYAANLNGTGLLESTATPYVYNGKMYIGTFDNATCIQSQTMIKLIIKLNNLLNSQDTEDGEDGKNTGPTLTQIYAPIYEALSHPQRIWVMDKDENITAVDGANALLDGTTNDYVWRFAEMGGSLYTGTFDAATAYSPYLNLGPIQVKAALQGTDPDAEELQAQLDDSNAGRLLDRVDGLLGNGEARLSGVGDTENGEEQLSDGAKSVLEKAKAVCLFLFDALQNGASVEELLQNVAELNVQFPLSRDELPADVSEKIDWLLKAVDVEGLQYWVKARALVKNAEGGFDLLKTDDGVSWEAVVRDGLGDPYNYGARTFTVYNGELYTGTANPYFGAQLWKMTETSIPALSETEVTMTEGDIIPGFVRKGTATSDKPSVAWVDSDGNLKALKEGTATITCGEESCQVTVNPFIQNPDDAVGQLKILARYNDSMKFYDGHVYLLFTSYQDGVTIEVPDLYAGYDISDWYYEDIGQDISYGSNHNKSTTTDDYFTFHEGDYYKDGITLDRGQIVTIGMYRGFDLTVAQAALGVVQNSTLWNSLTDAAKTDVVNALFGYLEDWSIPSESSLVALLKQLAGEGVDYTKLLDGVVEGGVCFNRELYNQKLEWDQYENVTYEMDITDNQLKAMTAALGGNLNKFSILKNSCATVALRAWNAAVGTRTQEDGTVIDTAYKLEPAGEGIFRLIDAPKTVKDEIMNKLPGYWLNNAQEVQEPNAGFEDDTGCVYVSAPEALDGGGGGVTANRFRITVTPASAKAGTKVYYMEGGQEQVLSLSEVNRLPAETEFYVKAANEASLSDITLNDVSILESYDGEKYTAVMPESHALLNIVYGEVKVCTIQPNPAQIEAGDPQDVSDYAYLSVGDGQTEDVVWDNNIVVSTVPGSVVISEDGKTLTANTACMALVRVCAAGDPGIGELLLIEVLDSFENMAVVTYNEDEEYELTASLDGTKTVIPYSGYRVEKGSELTVTPIMTEPKVISLVTANGAPVAAGEPIPVNEDTQIRVDIRTAEIKNMPDAVRLNETGETFGLEPRVAYSGLVDFPYRVYDPSITYTCTCEIENLISVDENGVITVTGEIPEEGAVALVKAVAGSSNDTVVACTKVVLGEYADEQIVGRLTISGRTLTREEPVAHGCITFTTYEDLDLDVSYYDYYKPTQAYHDLMADYREHPENYVSDPALYNEELELEVPQSEVEYYFTDKHNGSESDPETIHLLAGEGITVSNYGFEPTNLITVRKALENGTIFGFSEDAQKLVEQMYRFSEGGEIDGPEAFDSMVKTLMLMYAVTNLTGQNPADGHSEGGQDINREVYNQFRRNDSQLPNTFYTVEITRAELAAFKDYLADPDNNCYSLFVKNCASGVVDIWNTTLYDRPDLHLKGGYTALADDPESLHAELGFLKYKTGLTFDGTGEGGGTNFTPRISPAWVWDVTITPDDKSKYVGDNDPLLTATVEGLPEGRTVNYTLERTPGETAGTYAITVVLGENPDCYRITAEQGTFTIKVRPSGSGGGGGGVPETNPVNLPPDSSQTSGSTIHGNVSSSASNAKAGDKVTLTPEPEEGYQTAGITVTDANGKTVPVTKNADGTYSFIMPATAVNVEPTFIRAGETTDGVSACPKDSTCPISKFTDATPTAWYHDGVHWALVKGVMNGTSDTTFAPDGTATRAMVVTMLWRLAGEPASSATAPFTDVSSDAWYSQAVAWAAESGAVNGTSADTFSPNTPVTREQLAAILYRYAQAQGKGFTEAWMFLLDYPDRDQVSDWAYESLCWMTMHGVITGMGDGTLAPKDNATRAQIATMFMRFVEAMSE